ncbi:basement membrane-specific heparan sulfate proteoglycan core protein isoform X2 [Hippoglossus hippoglossus]|uniref:basement membrane-specific heparan sulfate proteoglycan core protein isoform X2 n=1 Tax=Hippoglossus hippoglossus TaxID=8267 RepID=UPI00148DCE20|nr:basement membrane-specific heparan sulfate proteoglycan core protein isoform X2 [Hippoglossus hippoglossus]
MQPELGWWKMGTSTTRTFGLILSLILSCQLVTVTQASKVWGEVPLPEDLEAKKDVKASPSLLDDDEDFAADEASGDLPSGEDDGSTPWPPESTSHWLNSSHMGNIQSPVEPDELYYRALVNFTDSLVYSPELEDIYSTAFNEISEAVVDTLESEYNRIPGVQTVSVVLIKKMVREDGVDVFVELDVGSDYNSDGEQIRGVLYSVVKEGAIASYVTSVQGFQFRRLGEVRALPSVEPIAVPVTPSIRSCMPDEHKCGDGTCILMEYLCDNRPDCRDMSDEINCELPTPPVYTTPPTTTTTVKKPPRPPSPPGPCRADQATCQSGECIPRDYICDGERDCSDGSDEFRCGTPSPCEPNEFKCRNGRCALKLWRCDGDNDCEDNSDETDCPTKGPGDRCAPEQFECLSDRTCIPASYQCDEEPDCPDRSDEYGCTPPSVTSPPEESIQAARGGSVTFTCQAVGVPTPIITWRLNWGHIPVSGRISMTSENGRGTLTIRDVKEADQGAYTCEAINAKGLVFGIPDGVLTLTSNPNSGDCPDGQFSVDGRCVSCFCSGITKICKRTGRYRNRITLRFTDEEDFKGVEVTYPSRPGIPPLSSTQLIINPEMEEFQLVDLSRRFLNLDSFWTLPRQFLGNKIDSYGGSLKYKVRYTLARGLSDPVEKPDVILVGNGRRLVYRRGGAAPAREVNQKEIKFTEDKWQHSNGRAVSREDLLMTLANLDSVSIRTIYDDHMVSVALSDIIMDTTSVEFSTHGHAKDVEECRCSPGYTGLSCEMCSSGFERVPGGSYLGTCAGCNCNGHASACDPINGHCLSCQHNTEGPQCDKCRSGYFGDPSRGRPDDCKPCPCPYYETSRRFSDTCFLDVDQQPTCDACRLGYTGRRCDKCASGYHGNPLVPNGKCVPDQSSKCDNRGTLSSSGRPCSCKNNVAGTVCDECKSGFFHLSEANPEGCLRCFCMGVTKQCASSTWNRDQVRGGSSGQLFSLSNSANTEIISEGITQRGFSEIVYRSFSSIPSDVYFWVLPESFRGDKVTAYGGELRYAVRFAPYQRSQVIDGQPDVVLQGNGIFLEHYSQIKPLPRVPQTITVTFRESAWRRADGQPCTREHLLMALADISLFMIRASYTDKMDESSISDIKMDVAVPHSNGNDRALEVEECACPQGYRGPSCQECDEGYTRTSSGLYLGTCERCDCNGHAGGCDPETGSCLQCLHNTRGPRCESCKNGFYGNPVTGGAQACQPCPCPGTTSSNQFSPTCYLESDGQPTCNSCPQGYTGRRCERCAAGYTGNPQLGQICRVGNNEVNGNCYNCDQRGQESCIGGVCRCKMNTEGPSCSSCKAGTFHLGQENKDGCLSCFCMGITQQCSSSTYYRDLVSSVFAPGNFQDFGLVNRQRTSRISTGFTVEVSTEGTQLSYSNFDYLGQEPHYWQLPGVYQGDKVGSYGGKLKYTISYVAGPGGTLLDDADIQIIGNDITLVARQPWQRRQQGSRETHRFEIVFREENWHRPDGMPATREHLMMVLADLDDILIRASYSTEMRSSSISEINMEVAVPNYSGLAQALEVEQCRCPPGYQGLSCQDCGPGYTRTGGGLYLGHCELCECNGHSDSCHPETGICTSCLHNTQGELCEQCAPGFFGDPTVGTPEDCQPCACPHADPDNQFSPTCESLGNGGYQCTACQPGYTGQYCERCASGYVGNPQERQKCRPYDAAAASLVVKVYPERVLAAPGGSVTLRCQVSGSPPHHFYWSREDGRSMSSSADKRRHEADLHFPSVQPSDAGVYVCTCRDQRSTNRSRAEIVVTSVPSKAIEVTVEEPKSQTIRVGSTVSFICTAKSKSPAYTLVWTRMGNGKLPNRAMDFNGILTIQNVQPEDAGAYVCTGSNMFAMDEGNAVLYVPEASQTQMFYTAYEMFEGHRKSGEGAQPVAAVTPSVLNVQQGQRAEFRCTVTGNPTPAIEWIGRPGNRMSPRAVIRGGVLTFTAVDQADEGDYTCKALNTHGEHTARVSLFVQKSNPTGLGTQPQVQVSPQNIQVHEGETLRLYCRASGSPTPKLTWLKNGGQIPAQAIPSHGFHQFKSNSLDVLHRRIEELQARMDRTDTGTLLIPNIRMSDSGTYMCVGSNSFGSNSSPIKVSVIKADHSSSVISIEPSIADVQEGQSLELNCLAPGNPPPQVTWARVSGYLSANVQVVGSRLLLRSASPEDAGEYTCRVQGFTGNPGSHVHQASVSVSVTSSSSRLQSPIIAIEPHSAAVRVGDSASFRCRVYSGAQPVRLEWKLANNQPLPDNVKVDLNGSVMTISSARPANHGAYRCVASNPFGITHTIVSLIVKESPVATVTPVGPVHIRVGEPINLECQASGEPRPSVSWHRLDSNRKTMLSSPVPMESNAVMQILVARPEDSGTYVCTARNNEGSTETKVEVTVQGGSQVPSVPRASVPEPLMIVVEGQTATLRCDAHGFPSPTITWSKLRSPLPWRHKIVNNSLVLPNVGRQDSGEYICKATNNMGTTEVTIMLDVETLPYATSVPDDVAVRVGEVIRLQCLAHGTPPLTYAWTKMDGSLSPRAQVSGGDLQINLATAEDAGSYKCVAGNKVGNSEVVAKVTVRSPLAVRVSPQVEVKAQGSAVEFTCSAAGGIETKIEWLKEGGALPPNHHVKDGVLRIENLEQSNEGVYICRASSVFGQAQDTARLTIQALPKVMINVRTSVQTVMIGNSVEFECQAVGDPEPTIQWSKVGGSLPAHIMVKGGMLKIERVTEADAGQYRCTATNDVGSVQSQVVLNVQSLPQIAALPETKEVTVGSDAVLPCVASGYPVPEIKWSKLDGELPPKCFQDVNALTVPRVAHEDSGTYVCTASNKQGKVEAFTTLQVHERVMPYFAQEPLSYLTLPTIKNAYKSFSIKINFRPDNVDGLILYAGMILYNGQRRTTGADFISLGLVGGRLEFRFDVGSGMATIRDPNPVKLGEFHTVELHRNQTLGYIIVDGGEPINGSSQGKFQGLDLNEELHVGGYPNYTTLAKTAGIKTGFVGCIRQLVIQGEEVIFKDLDRSSTGVTNCPTCKDHPCQNGGRCEDSDASLYKCGCPRGFTGSNCQHHSSLHCHSEACGPDATCISRQNGLGYDCRCHLGKFGNKCMDGELVTTPMFDGEETFIAYPPLTNIHDDLRVEMEFKPLHGDGLMFFCGGKKMKVEDFVGISMVEGHVEFRYELGTGQAILRSPEAVSLGQWHRVVAERNKRVGHLRVDQGQVESKTSPGKSQGLNIHTPMYLGGVPTMDILPKAANVSEMFGGCIGEVSINNKKVDLSYSFTESRAVRKCVDISPCDRRPCLNGGHCMSSAEYEYQCLCKDGFEGERCEVVKDMCQSNLQCQNGGSCVGGQCACAPGYTGLTCEESHVSSFPEAPWNLQASVANDSPYQYAAHFHNNGYVALPKSIFQRSAHDSPETIELEINTGSSEGLILWQGVETNGARNLRKVHASKKDLGEHGKGKDFISLGLQSGHLVFSYQLGSGEAQILSPKPINDGRWHKITAVRTGKDGYIQIDGGATLHGQSKGKSLMVNTKGSIYLGGAPDMAAMTGGKFSSGMTGCVRNLALMNARPGQQPAQAIDLQAHAAHGVNVQPCSS